MGHQTLFSLNWCSEGPLYCPAPLKTIVESFPLNTEDTAPLGEAKSLTLESNKMIDPRIGTLLGLRGPSAIPGLVVAVIVYAINRMFRSWAWPHVLKETRKRFVPFIAYRYSPPPVAFKLDDIWVLTTRAHSSPYVVFRRAAAVVLSHCVSEQTATRFSSPTGHPRRLKDRILAARTSPSPLSDGALVTVRKPKGCKPSELLSYSNGSYNSKSHDLNLIDRLGLWSGSLTVQPVREPFSLGIIT